MVALIQGSSMCCDLRGFGHVGRVVQLLRWPPLVVWMLVDDAGGGGDQVEVELAAEAFLDDLEVEEAEEAAAVAEAEGGGGLGLVVEAGVVEAELAEAVAEVFVVVGVHGEQAAPDDGDAGLEAGEGLGGGEAVVGEGVADVAVGDGFDGGGDEAHFAGSEVGGGDHLGGEDADLLDGCGRHRWTSCGFSGRA